MFDKRREELELDLMRTTDVLCCLRMWRRILHSEIEHDGGSRDLYFELSQCRDLIWKESARAGTIRSELQRL